MKLASYRVDGRASYGGVLERGLADLGGRFGTRFPDVRSLIASDALDEAHRAMRDASADYAFDAVEFLPAIPNPGKILCIGLNYEEHRAETRRDKTEDPAVFVRFPESQVGHRRPILLPRESDKLDFEGEIAVVIGRRGRRIAEADAWQHVAGYSCYNDASVRDWQWRTTQWTAGKNFAATGAFGPWIACSDEIAPGSVLTLVTRLNGHEMQRATTDMMIFPIPRLIAHCSAFVTLEPGDVIVTGTPGGVGARRDPPVFLKPGDAVEIEVSGVGVLVNSVARD